MEIEAWQRTCLTHCRWVEPRHRHTTLKSFSLTSAMSHVTKMHLGNCPALRGFVGRRRGIRMEKRIGCWSQPWIYVPVAEPFMRTQLPLFFRGELLVCLRSCCANISCPGAPATIAQFSPFRPPL